MKRKIFISYRRHDSAIFTGRLYDRLIAFYGADSIFIDIDSIPLASDFRKVVAEHIRACTLFLPIIGQQWAGATTAGRRIDNPEDYVRMEVDEALRQQCTI